MKTISIGIIALLLVLTSYSAIAPIWYGSGDDTGLVLRMSCEGNFLDSSGSGNHGTQSGGVTITSGVKGRACGFDGVDDKITISSSDSINFGTNNFTISLWFKILPSSQLYPMLVGKGEVSDNNWMLRIYNSSLPGRIDFYADGVNPAVYTSNDYMDGVWHHVVVMRTGVNGSGTGKVYVDGTDVTTSSNFNSANLTSSSSLTIASSTSNRRFDGSIDEVRIYNRSLSASEIYSLYNTSKTYKFIIKSTPTLGLLDDTPAPTLTDESGLVGWWKMDDLVNGNTTDSSGQKNNGSVIGATFNSGRWDKGYYFDGATANIEILNAPELEVLPAITFMAWVYPESGIADGDIVINKENEYESSWNSDGWKTAVRTDSNNWWWSTGTGADTVTLNKWVHLVSIWADARILQYVNGVLKTNQSQPGSTTYDSNSSLRIGRRATAAPAYHFVGKIDEVRIYNRSLSADEVKESYLSKGLVGHWKMNADERNSTDTYDSSGYNNHGKISGAVQTNEGRFKEGYKFDGVDDYIDAGNGASINISIPDFSVSMWLNPASATQQGLISKYGGDATVRAWRIDRVVTSGYVTMYIYNSSSELYSYNDICNSNWIPPNVWTNLNIVLNITHINCYMNGVLKESTILTANNIQQVSYPFEIGRVNTGAQPEFNGTIDEVRIYNRALTSTEVAGLYNGTKSNYLVLRSTPTLGLLDEAPAPILTDESGLVGQWKLDGDATDSSGQGNDGTVSGATIITDGRWNGAYDFDGNDLITNATGVTSSLDVENAGTISAWIRPNKNETNAIIAGRIGPTGSWFDGRMVLYTRSTGTIGFNTGNGTVSNTQVTTASSYYKPGIWYNVLGTFNGTHYWLYVNGNQITSNTYTTKPEMTGTPFNIGYWNGLGYFNGTIDEVRVYNRSLSAAEIQELYLSKGLVGHWKMDADQKNSTDTYDSSGYYNHGKITGADLTNEGRFKEAYYFDGINDGSGDDVITISNTQLLNSSAFTISGWIYSAGTIGTYGGAFGSATWSTNVKGLCIRNSAGSLISIAGNNTGNKQRTMIAGITTTNSKKWHHVAATYNGTTIDSFVNGISVGTDEYPSYVPSGTTFLIGAEGINADNWNGTIDEVRVYNRALTSTEIGQLYNGTKSNYLIMRSVAG